MTGLTTAFGILAAPATYALGRLLGRSRLAAQSALWDHHYLRGYHSQLDSKDLRSEMFGRFSQAAKLCASASRTIDDEMQRWFPASHAQLLQDLVCALIFDGKRDGYFVEIGVGDGTRHSNTLMLERNFGWSGILVEPARTFHETISGTRQAVLDRRAVAARTGELRSFAQNVEEAEFSRFGDTGATADASTFEVETVRLDDLLRQHGAPDEIDYISIDTEGSELDVLEGLSLGERRVNFLSIEHNFDRRRLSQYDRLLVPQGYARILPTVSEFDAWYLHRDVASRLFSP